MRQQQNTLKKELPADLPPQNQFAEVRTVDPQSFYEPHRKELEAIAQIESTGHQFRVHKVNETGMHKGMKSVSSYGIMPITAVEIAQKHPQFRTTGMASTLRNLGANIQLNHPQINKITENLDNDKNIAGAVWDYEKGRVKGFVADDNHLPFVVALAHRKGINAAKQIYLSQGIEGVMKHPYVSSFKGFYMPIKLTEKLKNLRGIALAAKS
jgi:hypothetical protein